MQHDELARESDESRFYCYRWRETPHYCVALSVLQSAQIHKVSNPSFVSIGANSFYLNRIHSFCEVFFLFWLVLPCCARGFVKSSVIFQKSKAQSVGSSGAPLLLRTLVAALSKVEDRHTEVRSAACAATEALVKGLMGRMGCSPEAKLAALSP